MKVQIMYGKLHQKPETPFVTQHHMLFISGWFNSAPEMERRLKSLNQRLSDVR